MKTMDVATDRLWGRIWQVGESGKGGYGSVRRRAGEK
jgi:hypothetical protein